MAYVMTQQGSGLWVVTVNGESVGEFETRQEARAEAEAQKLADLAAWVEYYHDYRISVALA